jgi:hypothetical protein
MMNTFFEGKANRLRYSTWSSNCPTCTGQAESHMLDLIVCLMTLHEHMRNCYVALDGADSDHHALQKQLNLTLLKYKEKASLNSGEIDWRKIC